MKAVVYRGTKQLEVVQIPEPELPEGGAVIKVTACGLCGSDIVKIRQGIFKDGAVPGHEIVGYIHKIGENSNFKVGDRVVAGHHVPCFNCVFCKNGNYSMCRQFKATNINPGGFCEYLAVSRAHLENTVFKVPDSVPDTAASFTEPVACCLRAVKRADVKRDDVVLVIGLGSIGLIMGQVIKHFGAKVVACDLLDERIQLARELGFDAAYKYTNDGEISGLVRANLQQEGADKVFLASGSAKSLPLATSAARDGGTILVFASVPNYEAGFANNDIYYRELTVLGSYSPSPDDLKTSLQLITDEVIRTDRLYKPCQLEDINAAIDDTCANRILKAYITL